MGVSTDGQICYGIAFEEGFEFPWTNEEDDGDYEDWWKGVNSYTNSMFNPFDDVGEYKEGIEKDDPRIDEYFRHSREWLEQNPFPVEVVYHCSDECAMYILAVPETLIRCYRGDVVIFNPDSLKVSEEKREALLGFCRKYKIDADDSPKWLLTSWWG